MKYLIIGTGGTGGAIGGFLAASGKDVDFIARGRHLEVMQRNGLTIQSQLRGHLRVPNVQAYDMEHYEGSPDVIFVCVKGYSLEETFPLIRRVARPDTMIIPILNIYGTGGRMAVRLPGLTVADGCVYITSYISAPGEITQNGPLFRIVYGNRDNTCPEIFYEIQRDLEESGVSVVVSDSIRRDAFQKFACVSPMAAAGVFFDNAMGDIRTNPRKRQLYADLVGEIGELAFAMGTPFLVDVVQENLDILDNVAPDSTTSMQKDLKRGGASEIDGLLFEVLRMAKKYRVSLPNYEMVAKQMGYSEVFDPVLLGRLDCKNRIVRSATRDGVENEDGTVSEAQLKIMHDLAGGEVGLIITGHFYVHPQGQASASQNGAFHDRFIPGMKRIVSVVHDYEGCVVAQINHAGGKADVDEPVAPSDWEYTAEKPARALTIAELGQIRQAFAHGASRAKQAGFDGVQVHMAHDYLLSEFLTPQFNTRTDEYGGSVENRFRLCREIIEEIHHECGRDYPVFVKINCNVQENDEQYEEDLLYILKQLEELNVTAVELSGCDFFRKGPQEHSYYLERAARLCEQVQIPLMLAGGIRSLHEIAEVLDKGITMVSMSRPFICQGDLVLRLRSGEKPKCINCNQCFHLPKAQGIRCVFHR